MRRPRVRRPVGSPAENETVDPVVDETESTEEYTRRPSRRRRAHGNALARRVLGRLTTRRAALLALVVCALALSVAVPLNTYLSQRDDLRSQQQQQAALRDQEARLEQREVQLSDTNEVKAEARTRLHFVMPGETPYEVQLPPGAPAAGQQSGTAQHPAGAPTTSWYQALWNSIVGSH
ncbi:MAG TPA: septum formation initiator family protein [Pseudonocardiaceae bacterium]|nr:septum formation initiator family protein [Pseudonocardiaceae bacterium]